MSIKKSVPNALTCCNLFSGCISIMFLISGMPVMAAVMIFVAGVFDFLDGFAARLLDAHSAIGADLDSLSDVVSFGVAPGFIMWHFMCLSLPNPVLPVGNIDLLPCIAFLLPVFSALRLAKFNVDTRQTVSFIGMPAPAMAIFVASLPLAFNQLGVLDESVLGLIPCILIVVILSFLMVCNARFFSFKMHSVNWKGNEVRWIFIIIAVVAFAVFRFVALPFVMLLYVMMSLLPFGKSENTDDSQNQS